MWCASFNDNFKVLPFAGECFLGGFFTFVIAKVFNDGFSVFLNDVVNTYHVSHKIISFTIKLVMG